MIKEKKLMIIKLEPVNDNNREAVLALSVREDQPFVATNEVSLRQADEANAEQPGVARPFAIYADEKLVGFCTSPETLSSPLMMLFFWP